MEVLFNSTNISSIDDSYPQSNSSNMSSSYINNTNATSTEDGGCELLGDFGYIIQGILGLMCFAVLVCKCDIN